MRIGIDLLWVRTGICGGTESYIRNLLDGFAEYDRENEYVLFAARDHAHSFRKYTQAPHMHMQVCSVESRNRVKRVIWENRHLDAAAARCRVDVMLVPVYSKPAAHVSGVPYVSVIHDFQALHYPEYFPAVKRWFLRCSWKRTVQTSDRLVVSSDAVRNDLAGYFPAAEKKAATIYIPVVTRPSGLSADVIARMYGIRPMEYFYCVSSMLPHKNLDTILRVMKDLPGACLVISGTGGRDESLRRKLNRYRIADRVVLTGFVPDRIRDCLYENCRLFLFPSVFEGFGMPPVEAMRRGKRVVMTRCSCLEEVTQGRAVYVKDPYSAAEWKEKIRYAMTLPEEKIPFCTYELSEIIRQYREVFSGLQAEKRQAGKRQAGKRRDGKRQAGKRRDGKRQVGKRRAGKRQDGKRQDGKKRDGKRRAGKRQDDKKVQVYENIYDIVSENYREAGKKLDYEKSAFLCSVGTHPQIVDVSEYTGLTNPEFYQAVHTAVYQRLPEPEEYERWSACFGMEKPAFQKKLLKKLSDSSVAAVNRMRFIHNPYFRQRRGIRYRMFGMLYGLTDKPALRRLGRKMPKLLQKAVRKVFL